MRLHPGTHFAAGQQQGDIGHGALLPRSKLDWLPHRLAI
jgi:hypothetical protein